MLQTTPSSKPLGAPFLSSLAPSTCHKVGKHGQEFTKKG